MEAKSESNDSTLSKDTCNDYLYNVNRFDPQLRLIFAFNLALSIKLMKSVTYESSKSWWHLILRKSNYFSNS